MSVDLEEASFRLWLGGASVQQLTLSDILQAIEVCLPWTCVSFARIRLTVFKSYGTFQLDPAERSSMHLRLCLLLALRAVKSHCSQISQSNLTTCSLNLTGAPVA